MLEKVREVIAEQLSIDPSTITEETKFKEDLGADSLDLYEVVMALEDSYGIEIPQEDLEMLKTVGAVIEYLKDEYCEKVVLIPDDVTIEVLSLVNHPRLYSLLEVSSILMYALLFNTSKANLIYNVDDSITIKQIESFEEYNKIFSSMIHKKNK